MYFEVPQINDESIEGEWDGQIHGLDAGDFQFEVTGAVVEPNKKGNGMNLVQDLKVIESLQKETSNNVGRTTKTWTSVQKNDGLKPGSIKRLRHIFKTLGVAYTAEGGFDTDELVGKRFWATVEVQQGEEPGPDGLPKTVTRTKISAERTSAR